MARRNQPPNTFWNTNNCGLTFGASDTRWHKASSRVHQIDQTLVSWSEMPVNKTILLVDNERSKRESLRSYDS
jgi:hypothetical protein